MYDSCIAFNQYAQREQRREGEGSECKGFQSYANSHAGYAQELRAAVPAASPSLTDLQLLLFLLLFLILLQLLLLLLLFLLLHLLLLFPLLLLFHLFCCCRFLCIFCMLHTFVRLLRQFSTNSIYLPPLFHSLPSTCCIGMHISRHCSTRSSSQARCQLTIYQYAMRMPCDFAYL